MQLRRKKRIRLALRIPGRWRKEYLVKRPPAKVRKDLVEAFDRIWFLKLQVWLLLLALAAEGSVIKWMASQLIARHMK